MDFDAFLVFRNGCGGLVVVVHGFQGMKKARKSGPEKENRPGGRYADSQPDNFLYEHVMTEKRNLFAELKEGVDELKAAREGRATLHEEVRIVYSPTEADEIASLFDALAAKIPLRPITNDDQYRVAVASMNALLDAGGADEAHRLATVAHLLGLLISDYEQKDVS